MSDRFRIRDCPADERSWDDITLDVGTEVCVTGARSGFTRNLSITHESFIGNHARWIVDRNLERVRDDPVNHPAHYCNHPSGIECIEVTRHFGFNIGNVIKYVWREAHKGASLEDLKKARWYLDDEIKQREKGQVS